jgi:branched-chain amino acid transport system permease protein
VPLVLGGRLSVCYNAYFAAGAYSVGLIATRTTLPLLLAIPVGVGVAASVGGVISILCRRLSGYHLAVATIAVAHVFDRLLIDQGAVTGGSTGIGNIPGLTIFGVSLDTRALLACGLLLFWLLAFSVNRLRDSVWGLALQLQRESPVAAAACGASVDSLRVASVALGAGIASLAGVLLALVNHFIIPESFSFLAVFAVLFVPIVGGSRSAWGSLIGAVLILWLNTSDVFKGISGALVFGAGTILVLLVAPLGFLGLLYGAGGLIQGWLGQRSSGAPKGRAHA